MEIGEAKGHKITIDTTPDDPTLFVVKLDREFAGNFSLLSIQRLVTSAVENQSGGNTKK